MLKGTILGELIGLPIGILFLAPFIPGLWIKLVFAVIWASFGVLHLHRLNEIPFHEEMTEFDDHWDFRVGLAIGLLSGATVVAVTGVGMVLYAALVLLAAPICKSPSRPRWQSWVLARPLGLRSRISLLVRSREFTNWLAAAPIVALSALLGAAEVSSEIR